MDREQVNILYAMDTFEQMRSKLISQTLSKDPGIYFGLHCMGNHLSDTYFERNKVSWLLEHFDTYKKIVDNTIASGDKKYKKDSIAFFSKIYREFLEWNGKTFTDSEIAVELLKELESKLDVMINFSEDWENGYNHLCVMKAKNDEKYKKLKKEMMEV